jgi:hypothetical protein
LVEAARDRRNPSRQSLPILFQRLCVSDGDAASTFWLMKRHLLQQVKRMALEDGGTRFPSMALMIPVWRFAQVVLGL